ncbi:MAG: CDP-glycerol glycerophosphotransferase family protein [Clostridia bacterium]|nr:CDP-glycerol glycerophosphotransferase family protein [Clostridia bacterium]
MSSTKIFDFLTKLSGIVPKNKKLWAFGCWDGHLYGDNSRYMFEYISEHRPDIKTVWISKEKSIVRTLREKGCRAEYAKSLKGMYTLCRAGAFFETSGYNDLSYFIVRGVKEIQLWHGMGFKNVGKFDTQYKHRENFEHFENGRRINTYDLADWCVASEDALNKYADSFDVPRENFHITGQPKDDIFICPQGREVFDEILDGGAYSKVIFYLPTHRKFGRVDDKSMLSEDMLKALNEKLAGMNVLLLYKPHYNDRKHFEDFSVQLSNIRFLLDFDKYGDIYQILPYCDAMISDYSGIIFGFLNTDRPMILFPYDYESYVKGDMGFCYDYNEVAAGPICYNWDEVADEIRKIVAGEDAFKEKRKALIDRFCPLHDGKNRERVCETATALLENK